MANVLRRRVLTQQCILTQGHHVGCEWNNFDPPAGLDQCHGRLAQVDGGDRDGEWVPLRTTAS